MSRTTCVLNSYGISLIGNNKLRSPDEGSTTHIGAEKVEKVGKMAVRLF